MNGRSRNPRGEGSLYERKSDGRHVATYYVNGKRRFAYGASPKQAADRRRVALAKNATIPASRIKLSEWVAIWLDEQQRDGHYAPGTVELYAGALKKHVLPTLGHKRLAAVDSQSIRDMLMTLESQGVSAGVRRRCRNVLKAALGEAYMREMVPGNVADRVRAPKVIEGRRTAISLAHALAFLAAGRGDRNEALYLLLLVNALREGEAFGLRPEDVDLEHERVHIRRQLQERKGGVFEGPPKGGKVATIPLAPIVADALRRHLATRTPTKAVPYVFTSQKGYPLRRSVFLRKVWHPFRKAAGLPYFIPHQLRHTTATLLKTLGIPVEIVREILRHASVETTAVVYQDEVPQLQRDALAKLSDLLGR